ncbi:unnamed protein product [Linum trigynum]|uniref:Uncharacterized protein n=1 Tax=Linum trigynum TaxID=586398 RepID=A0AAV2FUK3_9ROSI
MAFHRLHLDLSIGGGFIACHQLPSFDRTTDGANRQTEKRSEGAGYGRQRVQLPLFFIQANGGLSSTAGSGFLVANASLFSNPAKVLGL